MDFLTKPVRDQTLLDAVTAAIELDIGNRARSKVIEDNLVTVQTLIPREREVFRGVALGRLNKQIAHDLGVSEVTVKLHRGNVMRKLTAKSVADVVRAWSLLPAAEQG